MTSAPAPLPVRSLVVGAVAAAVVSVGGFLGIRAATAHQVTLGPAAGPPGAFGGNSQPGPRLGGGAAPTMAP